MAEANPNSRLEAFCDGVFAIALTLLIIEVSIPSTIEIANTSDFWLALKHIFPSIFAFLLSFIVIFITWVNHHASMKLVFNSSAAFIYANGLLLLTVVLVPFPTALLGEYILTDYSSPAVVVYNSVLALQAVGWISLTGEALRNKLTKDETAKAAMRVNNRNGYFAVLVYTIFAIVAFWLPHKIAVLTAMTWVFWLIHGIRMRTGGTQ